MHSNAGIKSKINDELVELVFNETVLLPSKECSIEVKFPLDTVNGWLLTFTFTDTLPTGVSEKQSARSLEDNGRKINYTYYSWYGDSIETTKPHKLVSTNGNLKVYIIMRTSANESLDRRLAHICIWKAL